MAMRFQADLFILGIFFKDELHQILVIPWICTLDIWKKLNIFSQMMALMVMNLMVESLKNHKQKQQKT